MTAILNRQVLDRAYPGNHTHLVIVLALLFSVWRAGPATAADAVIVEAAAGDYVREDSVASIALPPSLCDRSSFALTRLDTGQSVLVQVDRTGEKPRVVWIIRDTLKKGAVRKYRLAPGTGGPSSGGVSLDRDDRHLLVKVDGKPVFTYNHATVPSPDPKEPCYARSGYIHPLYDPSGRVITDDFNPDHAHQHGIMFAWRKTTFEGRLTNGWDQKTGTGRVEHVELKELVEGPVFGCFTARLRQVDLSAPGGSKPVLDETWLVRVYDVPDRFLFDIESTQTCAGPTAVTVEKIHYGGLMLRGHAAWHGKNYDYLTSEGRGKTDGNQTRPYWVDIHGPVDGQLTGVTIFDHPANFRFPQPVRLHPTMPYLCFAPSALGPFTIEPGKHYVSRYRFSVHDRSIEPDVSQRIWDDYAHPPTVRITANP
jgi:methane monooxygenase PmoA-like